MQASIELLFIFVKLHNNLASKALHCQAFIDSEAMRKILAQSFDLRY